MPTGHYERKPRVERIVLHCEVCGSEIFITPGNLKKRKVVRYCSIECRGLGRRKPESRTEVICACCGETFTKRTDHLGERNYCSIRCSAQAQSIPAEDQKWKNREYTRAYLRDYHKRNRLDQNRKKAAWKRANRSKANAIQRARRAGAASAAFSASDWDRMRLQYDYRCLACHRQEPEVKLEVDHIVPLARGGTHEWSNIQPLCRNCNASKGTKVVDYRPQRAAQ